MTYKNKYCRLCDERLKYYGNPGKDYESIVCHFIYEHEEVERENFENFRKILAWSFDDCRRNHNVVFGYKIGLYCVYYIGERGQELTIMKWEYEALARFAAEVGEEREIIQQEPSRLTEEEFKKMPTKCENRPITFKKYKRRNLEDEKFYNVRD